MKVTDADNNPTKLNFRTLSTVDVIIGNVYSPTFIDKLDEDEHIVLLHGQRIFKMDKTYYICDAENTWPMAAYINKIHSQVQRLRNGQA